MARGAWRTISADGQLIELNAESGRQKDATVRSRARPIVALGPVWAKDSRRAAENTRKAKYRTDHGLHTPDKLTCYLHREILASSNMIRGHE
jgi:hypothetical protein